MNGPPKEKPPRGGKGLNSTESAEASPSGGGTSISKVDELLNLLGSDVVLLPIPRGGKRPVIKGWQSTKLSKMQDPEYLAQLNNGGNIGVLLGGGLGTIDSDRDRDVEAFLAVNPKLRKTLRTRRVRGCNFWLRIKGDYPKSCKLRTKTGEDWGEWRADGNQTVVHGEAIDRNKGETKPAAYKIIYRAKPLELDFDEIRWPNELVLPWQTESLTTGGEQSLDELRRRYGEPYYSDETGNLGSLNESFWAGLFASENIVLWEPSERAYYSYNPDTGIYEEESVDAIKRRLSDRLLEASRQTNRPWLEKQRSDSRLNSVAAHLRGIVERRDAFAQLERRIHLANGVFGFDKGGELLPFSPAFVSRNRSPIAFDENGKCERFLNELVYPAMRPEDTVVFQKYSGQCMIGWNLIQKLLLLEGLGDIGKSTLALIIQRLVGLTNCTQLRTRLLEERFEIFRFRHKTLLIGIDVSPDFLSTKAAHVMKGLVGADMFDAEKKCVTGSFQVQGVFNVIITANSRVRVKLSGGDVEAWRRRLLKIRCEGEKPKKPIRKFDELLVREEGSGILNWAIAGAAMLLDDIEKTGDIVLTERQKQVVTSLLAESDSLRLFLSERVERAIAADLSVNEIVEAYAVFCPEMGWQPLPITDVQASLEGLMLELFHVAKSHSVKRDGRSVRGFFGVTFK